MNRPVSSRPVARRVAAGLLVSGIVGLVCPSSVQAQYGYYEWQAELRSMDLNAHNVSLPLGPADPMDPTMMWTPILVDIHVGESAALQSLGITRAYPVNQSTVVGGAPAPGGPMTTPPAPGDLFFVQSFFDVFFDISLTDVDPVANFRGLPDGTSMTIPNIGPAHMESSSEFPVAADPNLPNFGLVPPREENPYIGHFTIEIPLGADLNGNGENDKIKFTLVTHTVNGENRTFIQLPDGTVVDNFDTLASLEGLIVDESVDPPFSFTLTGPTTGLSKLVPEPAAGGVLASLGLFGFILGRRKIRRNGTV